MYLWDVSLMLLIFFSEIFRTSIASYAFLYYFHMTVFTLHSGVTPFLPHPHPHSVSRHRLVATPELGSEFFPQLRSGYYFQKY
jgi:hypothetical protein